MLREKVKRASAYLESSVQSQASALSRVCLASGTRRAGETRVRPFLILRKEQTHCQRIEKADVMIPPTHIRRKAAGKLSRVFFATHRPRIALQGEQPLRTEPPLACQQFRRFHHTLHTFGVYG